MGRSIGEENIGQEREKETLAEWKENERKERKYWQKKLPAIRK